MKRDEFPTQNRVGNYLRALVVDELTLKKAPPEVVHAIASWQRRQPSRQGPLAQAIMVAVRRAYWLGKQGRVT